MQNSQAQRFAEVTTELQSWKNNEFARLHGTVLDQDLDSSEIVAAFSPWVESIKDILADGLREISQGAAARLNLTLNQILDTIQAGAVRRGERFPELLAQFDGLEDVLIAINLIARSEEHTSELQSPMYL